MSEANFDIYDEIQKVQKALRENILSVFNSHMSVQHTAKWLSNMDLTKTKLIVLMHLSSNSKNAQPFKFKKLIETKLKSVGKIQVYLK